MQQKLGIVVGPLFVLVGLLLGSSHLSELIAYSGAPRVEATVLVADYAHVARGNGARTITLAAPGPVPLDDLDTAPGNLAPGDTVTALLHDGHALLPSQVGWSNLLVPIAAAVAGLVFTAVGVAAIRADPPPRPTDPEAWDRPGVPARRCSADAALRVTSAERPRTRVAAWSTGGRG